MGSLSNYSDHTYLNIDKLGQRRYLHRFPGGKITIKVLTIYFIDITKLVHIGNENGCLHHIIKTCIRC